MATTTIDLYPQIALDLEYGGLTVSEVARKNNINKSDLDKILKNKSFVKIREEIASIIGGIKENIKSKALVSCNYLLLVLIDIAKDPDVSAKDRIAAIREIKEWAQIGEVEKENSSGGMTLFIGNGNK